MILIWILALKIDKKSIVCSFRFWLENSNSQKRKLRMKLAIFLSKLHWINLFWREIQIFIWILAPKIDKIDFCLFPFLAWKFKQFRYTEWTLSEQKIFSSKLDLIKIYFWHENSNISNEFSNVIFSRFSRNVNFTWKNQDAKSSCIWSHFTATFFKVKKVK